jgi:tetratricopeptide (TPR) repeat protein
LRGAIHFANSEWQTGTAAFEKAIEAIAGMKGEEKIVLPAPKQFNLFRHYLIASAYAESTEHTTTMLAQWSAAPNEESAACAKICLAALHALSGNAEAALAILQSQQGNQRWPDVKWMDALILRAKVMRLMPHLQTHDWAQAWGMLLDIEESCEPHRILNPFEPLIGYLWANQAGESGDTTASINTIRTCLGASIACAPALHGLATVAFRTATAIGEAAPTSPQVQPAWEVAIAAWMGVIYSRAFWSGWNVQREKTMGMSLNDDELRSMADGVLARIDEQLNRLRSAGADAAQINLLKARVDYEKTCAMLMRDHIGETHIADWPAGMACGARMFELIQLNGGGAGVVKSLARTHDATSAKLNRYLLRRVAGFPTFLTENGQPRMAVDWLMTSPDGLGNDERKQLKSQAYLALGQQLSESGDNWKMALEAFRRANELGANVMPAREQVVKCGIERSREILNADAVALDDALQALQTAKAIAGAEPRLASNIAAVYTQRAQQAFNAENLSEAARLFRVALSHSNEAGTRQLFARVLERQVIDAALGDKNRILATSTARELLQTEANSASFITESAAKQRILDEIIEVALLFLDEEDTQNFKPTVARNMVALGRTYADSERARKMHALLLQEHARDLARLNQINPAIEALTQAYQIEKTQDRRALMAIFLAVRAEIKANNQDRYGALNDVKLALEWDPSNRDILQFHWRLQR